jgi:hypothetical protein
MHDRVPVLNCNGHTFSFEKLLEMFPIISLLFKPETVVILIHLDLLWIVPLKNLSVNPAICEITFWICDFVSQIKRLNPNIDLPRKCV